MRALLTVCIVALLVPSLAGCNAKGDGYKRNINNRGRKPQKRPTAVNDWGYEEDGNPEEQPENDDDDSDWFQDFDGKDPSAYDSLDRWQQDIARRKARAAGDKDGDGIADDEQEGPTPADKAEAKLRGAMGSFGSCIPASRLVELDDQISVTYTANISLSGVVSSASVYGGGLNGEESECLAARVEKMRFGGIGNDEAISVSATLDYKIPKKKVVKERVVRNGTPGFGQTVTEKIVENGDVSVGVKPPGDNGADAQQP